MRKCEVIFARGLNINILNSTLQDRYHITVALDGKQALDRAMSDPQPDIILLDIVLSDMDVIVS